ncbi:EPHX2 [Symbiodinium natans]|uniref:EPHX2 protein n=1 Tax=Symbiodinium natans TaxID=878477 RepID=A0A812R454_9DINO|nr:EPHX2 [Symbiodinium natans]
MHDARLRVETWSAVWSLLREDGHRILAADLPGHGASDLTPGSLEMDSLCDDVVRVLDFFDVQNGILVGHGVGGFIAIQYMLNYPKHARWRLPHGFVCIACSAGNLQETVGHETLRQLSKLFNVVRLPEMVAYFDMSGEVSISKRLGTNASFAAVRVALEASRVAASEWAVRNLSDMQWHFDLHPQIPALELPSALLLSSHDERVPRPLALRDSFQASGSLRAFKLLEDAGHFIPLTRAGEVAQIVATALSQ